MSQAGILLDRDGTIIVDYHYVGHVPRVRLIDGAADAIARFNRAGIPVIIVTNQSGVARGFYTEDDVHITHDYIAAELSRHDAHIDAFMFSPEHPDGVVPEYSHQSYGHKPNPGMALIAADRFGLDLTECWVVGDRIEDVELSRNIGASCVYLGKTELPHWYSKADIFPYPSLAAAADFIIKEITGVSAFSFPDQKYIDPAHYLESYTDNLAQAFSSIDAIAFNQVAAVLQDMYGRARHRLFVAGNGGAAAIASHFVCDHVKSISTDTHLQPSVIDLAANTALITAIANDIGYDAIFSRQIDMIGEGHDVLLVLSVSGYSANILNALSFAREHNITTIAITGMDGGEAARVADISINIKHSNYGIVEDVMQSIMHALAQFIRQSVMPPDTIASARF